VNVVSRLVKAAEPDTLVITEEAAAALPGDRWHLRELIPFPLPGLNRSIRLFAVTTGRHD